MWSKQEIDFLIENRPNMTFQQLATQLKRSSRDIRYEASKIGLRKQSNPKYELISELQWAYLAGLVDGEGTVTISQQTPISQKRCHLQPLLAVGMTDSKTIENQINLLRSVGFHVQSWKIKPKGKWRIMYYFRLARRNELVILLEQIEPYLITKNNHAILLIQFCQSRLNHFYSPYTDKEINIYKQIRNLNGRGKKFENSS